ncbi:MAG: hypothetical protein HQM03_00815 [Magnetococcales bacterium]|nr:hypothetical protein [Magnetococcales bacterium]
MSIHASFGKVLDQVLPPIPPFFEMMVAQADVLTEGFALAADFFAEAGAIPVRDVAGIEEKGKVLRKRHLDKLYQSYSTPVDRTDLLEAINTLEAPLGSLRLLLEEMEALGIGSDPFLLEMAVVLRESAGALRRGYAKLADTPAMADPDAETGMRCLASVDQVCRKALGSLYTIDEMTLRLQEQAGEERISAYRQLVDLLKKREVYQHFRSIAGEMHAAASVLHTIVVQIG